MRQGDAIVAALRRHPCVRRIVRSWRELTGGGRDRAVCRRTLVACSGGADSSALAMALGVYSEALVVGHVVHDLRPREQTLADRDAAAELAGRLGLGFAEREVRIAPASGNAEAEARRERYAALEEMAREAGCGFVATAHHADDQLETVLMRLLRGAGPRGLGGVAPSRRLGEGVDLIRPMLGVTRADAEAVCDAAGWAWREDPTNREEERVRARLRSRVLPELRELAPAGALRAAQSAELLRQAGALLGEQGEALLERARRDGGAGGGVLLDRGALAAAPEVVAGEALRLAHRELLGGRHADRLAARVVSRIVGGLGRAGGAAREYQLRGVTVEVGRDHVRLLRRDP